MRDKKEEQQQESLFRQLSNMKQPIPDWLSSKRINKPSLVNSLSFYYGAFSDICSEREFGEVVLPLKWSSIRGYATYYELNFEQSETFIFLIRQMDNAYIKKARDNGETETTDTNSETVQ